MESGKLYFAVKKAWTFVLNTPQCVSVVSVHHLWPLRFHSRFADVCFRQEKEEEEQNGEEDDEGEDGDSERKTKTQDGPWQKPADGGKLLQNHWEL